MGGELLDKVVAKIAELGTEYGLSVLAAVVILVVGRIIAGICRRISRKVMTKAKAEMSLVGFVSSLVYYAVLVFAIIAAISKLGVQTTSFIAVLGAAGLAVGLALQGSLANFASGVLILIFRPFKVGDFINAAGSDGVVQEVGIFTTTLTSLDNKKIIIPNSAVTGGTITNVTANDTRRVDLTAGISYSADMNRARQVIEEMLANHPKVLKDPAPTVAVVALADSSVNLVVRPWCRTSDYWDVYFSVTQGVKEALDGADISIPFPQQDVHLFQAAG